MSNMYLPDRTLYKTVLAYRHTHTHTERERDRKREEGGRREEGREGE